MDMPIIRIEIDGLKEKIQYAMATRGKDFDTMVSNAIDKSFNVETIQHKIDMQVAKAMDEAIDSLSESHKVKAVVMDIVLESLNKKYDGVKAAAKPDVGTKDGHQCNRNGCSGIMEPPEGECSCNACGNPPCSHCECYVLICSDCGEEHRE